MTPLSSPESIRAARDAWERSELSGLSLRGCMYAARIAARMAVSQGFVNVSADDTDADVVLGVYMQTARKTGSRITAMEEALQADEVWETRRRHVADALGYVRLGPDPTMRHQPRGIVE